MERVVNLPCVLKIKLLLSISEALIIKIKVTSFIMIDRMPATVYKEKIIEEILK